MPPVYASQSRSPLHHATLGLGWWLPITEAGLAPAGLHRRFRYAIPYHIPSSFSRLSLAHYRRISCEISLAIHSAIVARYALRDNLTLNDRNHRCRSFMSSDHSPPAADLTSAARSGAISLSPWVNERFPPWEQLLSAHDVARLTRRPKWVLLSMAAVGRFPRKTCYHGRSIGWLRADVLEWLAKDHRVWSCVGPRSPARQYLSGRQICLPFGCRRDWTKRRPKQFCSRGRATSRD